MLGIGRRERLQGRNRLVILAIFPQMEAGGVGVFAGIGCAASIGAAAGPPVAGAAWSTSVGVVLRGGGAAGATVVGDMSTGVAARHAWRKPLFDGADALVLIGLQLVEAAFDAPQPIAVFLRRADQVGHLPFERSSRWASDTTDDWLAAGSSLKPAVSAGRPLGKSWRCSCWTCFSSRSTRCSGLGGACRWAIASDGMMASAAVAIAAASGETSLDFPHASVIT